MSVEDNISDEIAARKAPILVNNIESGKKWNTLLPEETRTEMVTQMIQSVKYLLLKDGCGPSKLNPLNPHNFARKIEQQSFWTAKSKTEYFNMIADGIHEIQLGLDVKINRNRKTKEKKKLVSKSLRPRILFSRQHIVGGSPVLAYPRTSIAHENASSTYQTPSTSLGNSSKCKHTSTLNKNLGGKSDSEEKCEVGGDMHPNKSDASIADKGEPIGDFKKKLSMAIECPVCLTIPNATPIYQCNNGHLICSICREQLTNCPMCRIILGYSRSLISERLLSTLSSKC